MSDIPWLDPQNYNFPPITSALTEPNGLLAAGGDLHPKRLIQAYRLGIFPWYEESQPILWWSPSPRAVLFPAEIHISRSLKKRLRQGIYRVTCDTVFTDVVQACANVVRKGPQGTWITNPMLEAYTELYTMGVAHSIEVWRGDELVGGLYGIAIGRIFFGESMFSRCTDSSKVALVSLAKQLQTWGFALIDCQISNPHLLSLGAVEISKEQFHTILDTNIDSNSPQYWSNSWSSDL